MAESTRLFDVGLRVAAEGPPGVAWVNNLRFWVGQVDYLRKRIAPFEGRPVVPVTAGNGSIVIARGTDAVRQVFNDTETFEHLSDGMLTLPAGRPWSSLLVNLSTVNGERNRRGRKLVMPIMHRVALAHYADVFAETFAESKFARPGEPFDLVAELEALTRANMLSCLVGLDRTPANVALGEKITRLFTMTMDPRVFLLRFDRSWTPYGRWLQLVAWVHEQLTGLVDSVREQEPRPTGLSILCHARDEDGNLLSTQEIVGELTGLIASGYLTTAMAMSWALLTFLGDRELALDAATDKALLDAAVNETQRVIPTVPTSLPRRVARDVQIGDSPTVPRGSLVFMATLLEHRNPAVYENPHVFRPQRWLGDLKPTPFEYFPFGAGARRCLGAAFADLQVRTTIGLILRAGVPELLSTKIGHKIVGGVIAAPSRPVIVQKTSRTSSHSVQVVEQLRQSFLSVPASLRT